MPPYCPPDIRFWQKVRKSDGCWEWTAPPNDKGYGILAISGRHVRAHRFSWEIHNGAIPPGIEVCHRCDNRKCVRPDHLFLGTHAENMADMRRKGRADQHPKHTRKLTDEQVLSIVSLRREAGLSHRALAGLFEIDKSVISRILSGCYWSDVTGIQRRAR